MAEAHSDLVPEEGARTIDTIEQSDIAERLLTEILANRLVNVSPQLDFAAEIGFTYPAAEEAMGVPSKDLVPVLESLAGTGVLRRNFFERLLRCPQCRSVNLRPSIHCPRCGSGNIARGRVLEHLLCKYVGLEEEFTARGGYVCPKCKVDLRSIGSDYQSMGLLRKCRDCNEVFNVPTMKWRCLKCSTLALEDEVSETIVYAYSLDESKRGRLEFELEPKARLIEFLTQHGYQVARDATVKGRSGGEHIIDILATRDDGVVTHEIAIGVEVGPARIGLNRIFDFDSKTYDSGFHDKILIAISELTEEARRFAVQQKVKVLEVKELESILAGSGGRAGPPARKEPFQFQSRSRLVKHLKEQGYDVRENAEIKGRSGAVHAVDMLATRDDTIVTHRIAIGFAVDDRRVGLARVFDFDDKAYDAGIQDKVFVAVPGLDREAKAFAKQQRIKVFQAPEMEAPARGAADAEEQAADDR